MATQIRPDRGKRRIGVFVAVGALIAAAIVFAVTRPSEPADTASSPPPSPSPSAAVPSDSLVPAIVGLDGTTMQEVPGVPSDAIFLNLSPDGHSVAFVTWDTRIKGFCGGCSHHPWLATIGSDGSGARFLEAPGPTRPVRMPSWSPDSSRLAFVMRNDVYVMDSDGRHMKRLAEGGENEFPTWSPDGRTIAYDSSGPVFFDDSGLSTTQEIWTVPADGGTPTQVTNNGVPDQAPTYSPDGSRIAFFHDGALAVVDANGGKVHSLPGHPEGWTPRWSPDGKKIAFLDFRGDRATVQSFPDPAVMESLPLGVVEVVDVATGKITDLGVATPSSYSAVSWTPGSDGLLLNLYVPPTSPSPSPASA